MARLIGRGEAAGRARQNSTLVRLTRQLHARLPGVQVQRAAGAIVLAGRGLGRRWIAEPALRFLGRLS